MPPAAWLLARSGASSSSAGNQGRPGRWPAREFSAAAACAAVAVPRHLFAWWYFGSPIPHSIAAKRLIHPGTPSAILAEFGRYLLDDPYLLAALPVAALGIIAAARMDPRAPEDEVAGRPNARPQAGGGGLPLALGAFMLIYLGACAAGGITPFPWYVNPLIPPCLLLAAAGLHSLASWLAPGVRPSRILTTAWLALALAVGVVMLLDVRRQATGLREDWEAWEGAYEEVAAFVMRESQPGDRVLVGEVGVVGYRLPARIVLDSSGINSPEISRLREGSSEADVEWSRRVVKELDPDWIATSVEYLNIRALTGEPWFQDRYEKVSPAPVDARGQVVFRRRRGLS